MPLVSFTEKIGHPIQAGSVTITPLSRVLQFSAPGMPGGLIWNRPVAVRVEDEHGLVQRIPVIDVTRNSIWGMLGAGLVFGLLLLCIQRIRK